MRAKRVKRKGRVQIFSVFLLIITIAAFAAALIAYRRLWAFLEEYGNDDAPTAIDSYISILETEDFEKLFELNNITPDEFNTAADYETKLREQFGGSMDKLTYMLIGTTDAGAERYEIYSSGSLAQTIEITPQPDGSFTIETESIPTPYGITITVPVGAEVYINGVLLGEEFLTGKKGAADEYSAMDEPDIPEFESYHLDGLLNEPVCSAELDGEALVITADKESETAVARRNISEEAAEELSSVTESAAIQYAMYVTQDIPFSELSPYLLEASEFYRSIDGYTNEWYAEHEFTYDNVSISNMILYDDSHFSADISFTYHIIRPAVTYDYDVSYSMFFFNTENGWRLVTLA